MNTLRSLTATNVLVAITVAVFILLTLSQGARQLTGLELYFWHNPKFSVWQFVSYLFLHGGVMHLVLNMFVLWQFGNLLEKVWGARRFLIFYFVCGIGAGVIFLLINHWYFEAIQSQLFALGVSQADITQLLETGRYPAWLADSVGKETMQDFYQYYHIPAVGASGAIYGILVAFAMMFPNWKLMLIFLPVPIAAKFFVPVLLLIDLTAGLTGFSIFGANIAHFAHIGGALVGFILLLFWMRQAKG